MVGLKIFNGLTIRNHGNAINMFHTLPSSAVLLIGSQATEGAVPGGSGPTDGAALPHNHGQRDRLAQRPHAVPAGGAGALPLHVEGPTPHQPTWL